MKRFTILFTVLMMSCTTSNETGMNGAWQYVSGNYKSDDSTTKTTSDDIKSINMAKRLIKEEGLFIGGSSGSAVWAGIRAAKNLKKNQNWTKDGSMAVFL